MPVTCENKAFRLNFLDLPPKSYGLIIIKDLQELFVYFTAFPNETRIFHDWVSPGLSILETI